MIASSLNITFQPPGPGAYRIAILGQDASKVAEGLAVGGEACQMELPPGEYTALVQSLSSSGRITQAFSVGEQQTAVQLTPDPDQDASSRLRQVDRPREPEPAPPMKARGLKLQSAALPGLTKRPPPSNPRARNFAVGISVDTRPGERGGWRAAPFDLESQSTEDGEMEFRLPPVDVADLCKIRLTVSVAEDLAWRVGLPRFADGLRIKVRAAIGATTPDLVVSLRPINPTAAVLVGALERATPDEAGTILRQGAGANLADDVPMGDAAGLAIDALANKMRDPWAASAAAVLVARTGNIAKVADWTCRLADTFSQLTDAQVAAAWAEVAREENEALGQQRALDRLIDARRRGAPYFAATNALALEMLTSLALGEIPLIQASAKRERASWARRSRRALRTGAFLSWELPPGQLQQGQLPPQTYRTVLQGQVTLDGLTWNL